MFRRLPYDMPARTRVYNVLSSPARIAYSMRMGRVTSGQLRLHWAKRNFFQKVDPKKPKEFSRAVKYLNKQQSTVPTLIDEDGSEAHTSSQKANMLNSFFSKCFDSLSATVDESAYNGLLPFDAHPEELFVMWIVCTRCPRSGYL